jgi:hypothetical protein
MLLTRRCKIFELFLRHLICAAIVITSACLIVAQDGTATRVEVSVPSLAQASEMQLKSFPGHGRVVAEVPDIHYPKVFQVVVIEYDWGTLSFVRRTDNQTIALEMATIKFVKIPSSPTEALQELQLPSSNFSKERDGTVKWKNLKAGPKNVDVLVSPDLKSANIYFCPCSSFIEDKPPIK